jgi:hypothetical protein
MRRIVYLFLSILLFTACRNSTFEQKKLLNQADNLMLSHPDSALRLLKTIRDYRHLALPDRANYAILMTRALFRCDSSSSIKSDSLISIATQYYGRRDPDRAAWAWYWAGRCKDVNRDEKGHLEALLKAQEYAAKSKEYKLLGFICNEKARLFLDQLQMDSARYYNILSYNYLEKVGDKMNAAIAISNVGLVYTKEKQYRKALKYYQLALNECPQNEITEIARIHLALGECYYYLNKYENALYHCRQSLSHSDRYNYNKAIDMAMIFNKQNRLDSAIYYLKKCSKPNECASDYYQTWADVTAKQKDYNAIDQHINKLMAAKDSLFQSAINKSLIVVDRKYNFGQATKENQLLTIRHQRTILLILVLMVALAISVRLIFFWRSKIKNDLLNIQEELMEKEEAITKHQQEQSEMLQQKFKAQQIALLTECLQKNQLIAEVTRENAPSKRTNLQQILNEKTESITALYNELVDDINKQYRNLTQRLAEQHSNLTNEDLLICCMLLAGFDSATIASLMNVQPSSFNIRRCRIRKKINIQHENDLIYFLSKF